MPKYQHDAAPLIASQFGIYRIRLVNGESVPYSDGACIWGIIIISHCAWGSSGLWSGEYKLSLEHAGIARALSHINLQGRCVIDITPCYSLQYFLQLYNSKVPLPIIIHPSCPPQCSPPLSFSSSSMDFFPLSCPASLEPSLLPFWLLPVRLGTCIKFPDVPKSHSKGHDPGNGGNRPGIPYKTCKFSKLTQRRTTK